MENLIQKIAAFEEATKNIRTEILADIKKRLEGAESIYSIYGSPQGVICEEDESYGSFYIRGQFVQVTAIYLDPNEAYPEDYLQRIVVRLINQYEIEAGSDLKDIDFIEDLIMLYNNVFKSK